jgi:hypothetical protein
MSLIKTPISLELASVGYAATESHSKDAGTAH